jgi:hypothetical protein
MIHSYGYNDSSGRGGSTGRSVIGVNGHVNNPTFRRVILSPSVTWGLGTRSVRLGFRQFLGYD